ncbi:hypothetical protein ACFQX6_46315 [Streptosporangium lutulentum]
MDELVPITLDLLDVAAPASTAIAAARRSPPPSARSFGAGAGSPDGTRR